MANFRKILNEVLDEQEGWYSHDSKDLGGETVRGIARNKHPNLQLWFWVDELKKKLSIKETMDKPSVWPMLVGELKRSERVQATVEYFYQQGFWIPLGVEFEEDVVAKNALKTAINQGLSIGIKTLKEAKKNTESTMNKIRGGYD